MQIKPSWMKHFSAVEGNQKFLTKTLLAKKWNDVTKHATGTLKRFQIEFPK